MAAIIPTMTAGARANAGIKKKAAAAAPPPPKAPPPAKAAINATSKS